MRKNFLETTIVNAPDDDWDTDPDFKNEETITKSANKPAVVSAQEAARIVKEQAQAASQQRIQQTSATPTLKQNFKAAPSQTSQSKPAETQKPSTSQAPAKTTPSTSGQNSKSWNPQQEIPSGGLAAKKNLFQQTQNQSSPSKAASTPIASKVVATKSPSTSSTSSTSSLPKSTSSIKSDKPPSSVPTKVAPKPEPVPPPPPIQPEESDWGTEEQPVEENQYTQQTEDQYSDQSYSEPYSTTDQPEYQQNQEEYNYEQNTENQYSEDQYSEGYNSGKQTAVALYDYDGQQEGDLNFRVNDIIEITDQSDPDGWWYGECNGLSGVFPSNFVELQN